jgi:hypothetical protein
MSYRVVYGETMPAWEKEFPTLRAAKAFAKEHESFGDIIFSIAKVKPNDSPTRSLAAMMAAGML